MTAAALRIEARGRLADVRPMPGRNGSSLVVAEIVLSLPARPGPAPYRLPLVAFGEQGAALVEAGSGAAVELVGRGELHRWQARSGAARERLQCRVESVRVVGAEVGP